VRCAARERTSLWVLSKTLQVHSGGQSRQACPSETGVQKVWCSRASRRVKGHWHRTELRRHSASRSCCGQPRLQGELCQAKSGQLDLGGEKARCHCCNSTSCRFRCLHAVSSRAVDLPLSGNARNLSSLRTSRRIYPS